jgi:DNA polymerase-1
VQAGYEADDVLATLACRLRERDIPTLVVSGDRDLLQTAYGSVRVLFIGARGKDAVTHDAASVEQRFGVHGPRLASYTALVGDTSDNLPGVPGVGPRTAATLLNKFHDIDALLSHIEEVTPPRLRESLARAAEQLRLNEELARLHETVPLPENPPPGLLSREVFERMRGIFDELEFRSLSARLEKIESAWPAT